ncbi:PepSY domain-containing protein [Lutibacter sp.]|uniref:PepSY domain-containing protein n=1 Tax=Lutibacter sp. TaxID=1925666 RepID=UPI0027345F0D|nr:PepSY domain-containing protein [Lutibacter sp.]MDP3313190.1 PepSY domain-containing protein [Lutibacter sp.]
MIKNNSKTKQAKILRIFRKVHRSMGAMLFVFFFFIAISGMLLGWKNHSSGLIIPTTEIGSSSNLKHWLTIDSLHKNAVQILQDSVSSNISLVLDRIDIRKEKGIVKFIFEKHLWEVQLDGVSGDLLHLGKRQSDLIESIHDGSILDAYFGTTNTQIKVIYTSIMGFSLLLFTITGFWLWYGPKKMKRLKNKTVSKI